MQKLLLSTVTLLVVPAVSVAAPEFNTHTHTTPIELKPISQLDKAYKTAGVCFLGIGDCAPSAGFDSSSGSGGGGDEDFDLDTTSQCLNEGFTPQSCNAVQTIDGVCPYNSAYGRGCKCNPGLISCPAGQVGEGDSCNGMYASCKCDPNLKTCSAKENGDGAECGGKYESCVCKPEYQYDGYNCTYPQSTTGDECGGKYTECVCPVGVDEGEFGCEEYYPEPCNNICKIAYSDNCHIRSDNIGPYGCEKVWKDCETKCEVPYFDNCHERVEVNVPSNAYCSSHYEDCGSKCSAWACHSGYYQSGSTCVNPCDNRTAVSIPSNAHCTSYYTDCSSKCSAWACNSGYNQSGNYCEKQCVPKSNESGCSYGTKSCSDGCGGTRTCCKTKCEVSPCSYGCYTDFNCAPNGYCSDYNECGGCSRCILKNIPRL